MAEFKIKQLKTQLYFLIQENDSLRMNQPQSKESDLQKQLLLQRQLCLFYKQLSETVDQGLQDRIFELENQLQTKSNLVLLLEKQIKELTNAKGVVVVEKQVVQPTRVIMQLQGEIQRLQKVAKADDQSELVARLRQEIVSLKIELQRYRNQEQGKPEKVTEKVKMKPLKEEGELQRQGEAALEQVKPQVPALDLTNVVMGSPVQMNQNLMQPSTSESEPSLKEQTQRYQTELDSDPRVVKQPLEINDSYKQSELSADSWETEQKPLVRQEKLNDSESDDPFVNLQKGQEIHISKTIQQEWDDTPPKQTNAKLAKEPVLQTSQVEQDIHVQQADLKPITTVQQNVIKETKPQEGRSATQYTAPPAQPNVTLSQPQAASTFKATTPQSKPTIDFNPVPVQATALQPKPAQTTTLNPVPAQRATSQLTSQESNKPITVSQPQPAHTTTPKESPAQQASAKPLQQQSKPKAEVTPIEVDPDVEYYEEDEESEVSVDMLKQEELKKLRQLLKQNKEIPKVIIIQDGQGNDIEYEVIEESESGLSLRQTTSQNGESVEYYEEVIEESEEENSQYELVI